MGSCFGHISGFQANSKRNPIVHISSFNSKTNEVELRFLLAEPQYVDGSVPFSTHSSGVSFRNRTCSFLSWEHLKASQRKLWNLILKKNETINLQDLKPELNHSTEAMLTLDPKYLFKMKTGSTTGRYLTLDSPPSSIDLEWENEGLSATTCVQSDYATTLATISSDEQPSDLSNISSIESLEWDMCLSEYSESRSGAKHAATQLEDFTLRTLKESNNDR